MSSNLNFDMNREILTPEALNFDPSPEMHTPGSEISNRAGLALARITWGRKRGETMKVAILFV